MALSAISLRRKIRSLSDNSGHWSARALNGSVYRNRSEHPSERGRRRGRFHANKGLTRSSEISPLVVWRSIVNHTRPPKITLAREHPRKQHVGSAVSVATRNGTESVSYTHLRAHETRHDL